MRTRIVPILIACAATAQPALAAASATSNAQVSDFLYAIRVVESGNRYYDCPTGSHGEQGPYQFRREVWRQYTHASFWQARTELADQVALRHYSWLVHRLREAGRLPTAWAIAAAWNGGIDAVLTGRLSPATRSYATRVTNLFEDQLRVRASLTPRYRIVVAQNN